jgi:hypothetical protein
MAPKARKDRTLLLQGLKAMVAGAVQDRAAAIGVVVAASFLLLTAWVLGVAALVVLLAGYLGTVWALFAVTAGLVVLALAIVGLTKARNRSSADQRAMTRALWAATAANAASTLLRGEPQAKAGAAPSEPAGTNHRSILLFAGGLALILLAFLLPSGSEDGPDTSDAGPDARPDAGPDAGQDAWHDGGA